MSVPQGTTKILNLGTGSVADNIWAVPLGPISGFYDNSTNNQLWIVKKVSENEVAFESVANPGYFASVYTQEGGVQITGSQNPTSWLLNYIDPTVGTFQILTTDNQYGWSLENNDNYVPIFLRPTAGTNATTATNLQWQFSSQAS